MEWASRDEPVVVVGMKILMLAVAFVVSLAGSTSTTQGAEPNTTTSAESTTGQGSSSDTNVEQDSKEDPNWPHPRSDERAAERTKMIRHIRKAYRFSDAAVLNAMEQVPRHWFVPAKRQKRAYADMPLPIGHGQTISQPFIVAYMTHLLELSKNKKVLEVGTGSGYQAALLTEFTPHVYSIEIVKPLAEAAEGRLKERGYKTIEVKAGDGYWGWAERGPFDAIIVTCAADHVPPSLVEQLKPSGKMCIPVGGVFQVQNLMLISKDKDGKITSRSLMPVRFVPLVRRLKR